MITSEGALASERHAAGFPTDVSIKGSSTSATSIDKGQARSDLDQVLPTDVSSRHQDQSSKVVEVSEATSCRASLRMSLESVNERSVGKGPRGEGVNVGKRSDPEQGVSTDISTHPQQISHPVQQRLVGNHPLGPRLREGGYRSVVHRNDPVQVGLVSRRHNQQVPQPVQQRSIGIPTDVVNSIMINESTDVGSQVFSTQGPPVQQRLVASGDARHEHGVGGNNKTTHSINKATDNCSTSPQSPITHPVQPRSRRSTPNQGPHQVAPLTTLRGHAAGDVRGQQVATYRPPIDYHRSNGPTTVAPPPPRSEVPQDQHQAVPGTHPSNCPSQRSSSKIDDLPPRGHPTHRAQCPLPFLAYPEEGAHTRSEPPSIFQSTSPEEKAPSTAHPHARLSERVENTLGAYAITPQHPPTRTQGLHYSNNITQRPQVVLLLRPSPASPLPHHKLLTSGLADASQPSPPCLVGPVGFNSTS
ncbi:hypothetical protein BDK51DRAFT_43666 [Blyttiomyces helicus]|uniref:Uncharacterized protein n=1 Tax=Blyttiomyces helicus TaxID=388810 RepID=A0A4P9WN88_9FUNG|nr:hypothetical protein BDK51DRAFT_43666 [Blyttiomyces helicus]|eukprot:RKO94581.1 hypothetical protein BDK51DRAFT_43666 [Blyttiomyces helicus]